MIDIPYLKTIGIHNYLLENQMVTGLEHNMDDFIIDFERDPSSKAEEKKEDAHIFNTIRYTSIYRRITEELNNNKDKEEISHRSSNYRSKKISFNIPPHTDLAGQTNPFSIRGIKISTITKAQQEHEKKEKVRRQFEATLRRLKNKNRMNNKIYKNYLIYLIENMDILDSKELEMDLQSIRLAFSPSKLAKSWEEKENKKDKSVHLINRKKQPDENEAKTPT